MTAETTKRYAIDIRVFLATMTISMVLAFGAGLAFGPGEMLTGVPLNKWQFINPDQTIIQQPSPDSPAYEPSGQHLLIDIKNIDSDFLDSEDRLANAMVESVKAGGLTMLSYHCHKLIPSGVSCVGVLLESHISFHTWPDEGVITLDLFTCGSNPLIPLVPKMEELFAIGDNTVTRWSHELRGFRLDDNRTNYLDHSSDLAFWVLSPLDMHLKECILSTRSKFQKIDIWDILEVDDTPSYEDALRHNLQPGDPRWLTPEIATPDRLLFLDGTLQSLGSTEREYHEALVHPAMFAHPSPKHVAMIGGGEGATLREVLKHKTVESATMIELDSELVAIVREYLPKLNDCSDLVGSVDNCFDDPRVNLIFEEGVKWFVDRFGKDPLKPKPDHPFDVIILDALDPEDDVQIAEMLYNDATFASALLESLSEDGVLIIQVGTAPNIHDPRPEFGVYQRRERMFNMLEANHAVKAMFAYEEAHCGFLEPHSFLVVCKDAACKSRWQQDGAVIDFEIYDRIVQTKSREGALVHFDAATQSSYRYPPKAWETVYCRRDPIPFECAYMALDPKAEIHEFVLDDEEKSSFKLEAVDPDETPRIIATRDIPKGSYIMPSHVASSFITEDRILSNLHETTKVDGNVRVIEDVLAFFDKYGHNSSQPGLGRRYVEVGATIMIRESNDKANVGRWFPRRTRPVFSPVHDRHHLSFDLFLVATKDIAAGEELFKEVDLWNK